MKCRCCGSENLATRQNVRNHDLYDLYCCDCGVWQRYATREERSIYNCKRSKSSITCPCCGYPIIIEVKIT